MVFSIFQRPRVTTPADRLLYLIGAHGIDKRQIPRLLPAIGYAHVEDRKDLLQAITPSVLDSAAQLFGVRGQWLEGSDELVYAPAGSRHAPAAENVRLIAELAASAFANAKGAWRVPLCALTTLKKLDRASAAPQQVLPLVIEPTGAALESPLLRCRIFGGSFDWRDREQRLALKALVLTVWQRCHRVVPIYEVPEDELLDISGGLLIPSVVFNRPVITSPSLEDFVQTAVQSRVAKEVDELPEVIEYLHTSGLEAVWDEVVASMFGQVTDSPAGMPVAGPPSAPVAPIKRPGKRDQLEQAWAAILSAASGIWTTTPEATYAEVIRRLQSMPLLKAAGLSESALRKRLAAVAPPGVRGKPGRRPKQSP